MSTLVNVYDAFISYKTGSGNFAKWAEMYPQEFAIVAEVREMKNA